ncbi:MAG TPA: DUF92 domain-containing protein [Chthonomonadaceae bacterium]|nr:DUF92 domain-containing protein [Chthonomonadaceae bacterium]
MTSHAFYTILMEPPFWLALLFAAGFAALARWARWVNTSGALSMFVVGLVVFGLGGGKFLIPLLTFFLSSSLLSRLGQARKSAWKPEGGKDSARDAGQVWANGGMAVLIVLIFALTVHRWPVLKVRSLLMLYLAALATVNSDTWATEIGGLARGAPRLLTNWQPIAPGASGAITLTGVLAAVGGAVIVPLSALPLWRLDPAEFAAVAWAGFLGSFIDSLLGAGIQAKYRDPETGEPVERAQVAGRSMVRVRGLIWMTNDMVNFLASAGGVLCAWILLHFSVYRFY